MRWTKRLPVMRLAGLAAIAAMASGCWLQQGGGPEFSYSNPDESTLTATNVGLLGELWFDSGTRLSEVIVSNNVAYYSEVSNTTSGQVADVIADDATTGKRLWTSVLSSGKHTADISAPVIVGDEVWVSFTDETSDHQCSAGLLRLDPDTGAIINPGFPSFRGFAASIVPFGNGKVAWTGYEQAGGQTCPTVDRPRTKLYVADVATVDTLPPWTAPVDGQPVPVAVGNRLVVDGRGYDANGCGAGVTVCEAQWEAAVGSPVQSVTGSRDGRLFVTSETGRVASIDPATGAVLWSASGGGGAGVAVADGVMYAARGNTLSAYPAGGCGAPTCSPTWSSTVQNSFVAGGPTVAGGLAYAVFDDQLRAYRAGGCGAATCAPVVSLQAHRGGPITVSDGKVFVVDGSGDTGRVTAYAPAACASCEPAGAG